MPDFKLWFFTDDKRFFPKYGLITSKKMKRVEIHFFQTIIFKLDAYLI